MLKVAVSFTLDFNFFFIHHECPYNEKKSVIWRKLALYKIGGTKDFFLTYLLNLETILILKGWGGDIQTLIKSLSVSV